MIQWPQWGKDDVIFPVSPSFLTPFDVGELDSTAVEDSVYSRGPNGCECLSIKESDVGTYLFGVNFGPS